MPSKRARKYLQDQVKFVYFPKWLIKCRAWRMLPPAAKVLYIDGFEVTYTGVNNGDVKMSEREAAKILGCARETASKAIAALEEHGLIRPRVKGAFHVKTRCATRWILTRYEFMGGKATMDFTRWNPDSKSKQRDQNLGQPGLEFRPDGPETPQSGLVARPDSSDSVPPTGLDSRPVLVNQGGRGRAGASGAPAEGDGMEGGSRRAQRANGPGSEQQQHQQAKTARPRGRPSRVQCWPAAERQERGWTQYQLAERAGYTRGYVAGLEQGRCEATPEARERIARALNCAVGP